MPLNVIDWPSRRLLIIFNHFISRSADKTYVHTLTKDIQSWKHNHIHHLFITVLFFGWNNKPDPQDYDHYIRWLDYTGKLDNYLDRSISYIFMRDLGKALDSPDTQARIRRVVDSLKNHLTRFGRFRRGR